MISGIVTALLLVLFVGGWIWAWSPKRKREQISTQIGV